MRVLFIAGYVRSGSTLLTLILGDQAPCCSLGEMAAMVYGPNTSLCDLCMCGRSFQECEFWKAVWGAAFPGVGQGARSELCQVLGREAVLRSRLLNRSKISSTLAGSREESARLKMVRLYEAAALVSGSETLVDSSKTPGHAYMLKAAGLSDLRVIHLVRNPCAVVFSQSRVKARTEVRSNDRFLPKRSLLRSIAGWTKANLLSERLSSASKGYVRIRYEDLLSNHSETLAKISEAADLPPGWVTSRPTRSATGTRHSSRHDVAGNPSKFGWTGGPESIVPDLEWKTAIPSYMRSLITFCTLPLMWRYGYFPSDRE